MTLTTFAAASLSFSFSCLCSYFCAAISLMILSNFLFSFSIWALISIISLSFCSFFCLISSSLSLISFSNFSFNCFSSRTLASLILYFRICSFWKLMRRTFSSDFIFSWLALLLSFYLSYLLCFYFFSSSSFFNSFSLSSVGFLVGYPYPGNTLTGTTTPSIFYSVLFSC